MVQAQQMRAAAEMMKGLTGGTPDGGQAPKGPMGQYGLLAMIAAREDGCTCRACGLLRKVVDDMFTMLLKKAGEEGSGGLADPPATAIPEPSGAGDGGGR